MTTRRYVMNTMKLNYDKIICWEHPNFADTVIDSLNRLFKRVEINYFPSALPLIDLNLVIRFIYKKV